MFMTALALLVLGFLVFETVGAGIHRLMHARWTGPLWRSHMAHHQVYPPRDGLSDEYRAIGGNSAGLRYVMVGALASALLLWLLPLGLALMLSAEMLAIGLINDFVHDASHLNYHWLDRFAWFKRLRELHQVHHRNMKHNFGLVTFLADRLFGTYES